MKVFVVTARGRMTLGNYVAFVKRAIAYPNASCWGGLKTEGPTTGRDIRWEFLEGVHDRINQAVPYRLRGHVEPRLPRWRKLSLDWQRAALQLARRVNTPRLIVRENEVPPEFRRRLAGRLTRLEDL
jgi:hypothetical protein